MLLRPDCIPCILKMTITSLRKLPLDENSVKTLYTDILENPALHGLNWDTTSVVVIEDIWRKIVKTARQVRFLEKYFLSGRRRFFTTADWQVYGAGWTYGNRRLMVIINSSRESKEISVPFSEKFTHPEVLFAGNGHGLSFSKGRIAGSLPPAAVRVIQFSRK